MDLRPISIVLKLSTSLSARLVIARRTSSLLCSQLPATAEGHAPEDFLRGFNERVGALAANQDLLSRNRWRGVHIDGLARTHLAPFANLIGSRITLRGPKLCLNAASAEAIGLSLHELATNAGKYGALSVEAGHIDVRWGVDSGMFNIHWTERNGRHRGARGHCRRLWREPHPRSHSS
jgi:two-component sensor histidine kinase